jgi:two-component system, NtrC family, sensor histidine kinase HydH
MRTLAENHTGEYSQKNLARLPVFARLLNMIGIGKDGRFELERLFAILSLLTISAIVISSAYLQSKFLTEQILLRDATVTQEFIANIVTSENTDAHFKTPDDTSSENVLKSFYRHLKNMPDVLGVNVYSSNGEVLLSSNPELAGKHYNDNEELEKALKGELIYETGVAGATEKLEHANMREEHVGSHFIETYVPVRAPKTNEVVGIVEIYKIPLALEKSLNEGLRRLWLGAISGGSLLFAVLFWVVRHAAATIAEQNHRLREIESLAMIGETAAAVTHSIRNPLASIRAAAELIMSDDLDGARESARDIITETDRLTRWTREMLLFSNQPYETARSRSADLNEIVSLAREDLNEIASRNSVAITYELQDGTPKIKALPEPTRHVITSIVANAVEAMPRGGKVNVRSSYEAQSRTVDLEIKDTGPGISKDMIEKALKPFFSTKSGGTGLGLPLAKQIMTRFGGELRLRNEPTGLIVTLSFQLASE